MNINGSKIEKRNFSINDYLKNYQFSENVDLFSEHKTITDFVTINEKQYPIFVNEFWTAKQRQANSLHEISYRACFKPQLPRFFIKLLSKPDDIVYDPFSGRGTTVLEAALLKRNIIANDINPLSKILSYPRLFVPNITDLEKRLNSIVSDIEQKTDIDLSMFYHQKTESEILSLKNYLKFRNENNVEDELDNWIRMVATSRLTGHSKGFFSIYTLPPNQAVSQESQKKINEKRKQKPEYRDTKKIILKKTISLIRDINQVQINSLRNIGEKAIFLTEDARNTEEIKNESVQLVITSPPFLNVVQYAKDNWLRCWFNSINNDEIVKKITMSKKIDDWCKVMGEVFKELFRIVKNGGYVIFEVGEVKRGKIKLEEFVVPLGIEAGFECEGIMINEQEFTKTANIWGIDNNSKGTNTNRMVIFKR